MKDGIGRSIVVGGKGEGIKLRKTHKNKSINML
jgi:hypothetical protein